MALCRMREIVPAWLPQQPISVLQCQQPNPMQKTTLAYCKLPWGPGTAKPGGVLCGHVGESSSILSVCQGVGEHLATQSVQQDGSGREETVMGLDSMLAGN